jgi:polar amino acid transport system substrate-binding protein
MDIAHLRYLLPTVLFSYLLPLGCLADSVTFLIADGTVEPYQVVSPDPDTEPHSGILIDVLERALRNTDVQLNFVVRPYKRIKMDILAQRHTNWISYGSPAWLDERVMALGEYTRQPILQSHYVLASMAGPVAPELGDVQGKKVIVILGYDYFPTFKHWVAANHITLVRAPSHRHALAMLRQGRGDFYLAEEVRVRWQIRNTALAASDLHLLDFSAILPPSILYLLLDKRMPIATRERINQQLLALQDKGVIADILSRYQ